MPSLSMPSLVLALVALALGSTGCSGSSGSPVTPLGGSGEAEAGAPAGGAHDDFHVLVSGGQEYEYDCAAQPAELSFEVTDPAQGRAYAVMKTLGCSWPASNPTVEIDVQIVSKTPIHEQTFDLSSTSAEMLEITAGLVGGGSNDPLFASWENNATGGAGAPLEITMPGTSGSVVVHSFDPATGALDISLNVVTLPGSALTGSSSSRMTIASAEIVR
jgi:hypothetical protein